MTHLYNCRHDGDQYRITKFDDSMNIESSYLTTLTECTCPAGVRDTCRHRQMLPRFQAHNHIGDGFYYDFDRDGWVDMRWLSVGVELDNEPVSTNGSGATTASAEDVHSGESHELGTSPAPAPSSVGFNRRGF